MDAATRWETEAIRAGRRPRPSQQKSSTDWVTLREAAGAAGVPVGTVRSWAKSGAVPSYLESDGETSLRMVDLDAVRTKAAQRSGRQAPGEDTEERETEPSGPNTMIVPIDAWNKMLLQLGNLHEAGQQLAEARERAAKAETEAEFLRAQLKELRGRSSDVTSDRAPQATDPAPHSRPQASDPASHGGPQASEPASTSFVRYIYRGWRSRRKPRS